MESEPKNVATECTTTNHVFDTPTMAQKVQKQHQDQRDLQIFELLEHNLDNSGVFQNSGIMKQLVQYILTQPTKSPIQQELHFDGPANDNSEGVKRNVRFAIDSDDRANQNEDSECETIASTDIEEMDHSETSTPITKTPFELFQTKFIRRK